jgi:hypothetical protein
MDYQEMPHSHGKFNMETVMLNVLPVIKACTIGPITVIN